MMTPSQIQLRPLQPPPARPPAGLGLDAGGTATRWAVADTSGRILAEGSVPGVHGRINHSVDLQHTTDALHALVSAATASVQHSHHISHMVGGISGYDSEVAKDEDPFTAILSAATGLPPAQLLLTDDIWLAYLSAHPAGEGVLVYAGTGSMSAHVDLQGHMHRVGGRGILLDDAGGGFWIAREALKRIWRREESAPGSWQHSPLADRLFQAMGGTQWHHTRQFVYGQGRGDIGKLAVHVAESADDDPMARGVLCSAGFELARLANIQIERHGPLPISLTGGAAHLHPAVFEAMRAELSAQVDMQLTVLQPHHKAARMAAQNGEPLADLLKANRAAQEPAAADHGRATPTP